MWNSWFNAHMHLKNWYILSNCPSKIYKELALLLKYWNTCSSHLIQCCELSNLIIFISIIKYFNLICIYVRNYFSSWEWVFFIFLKALHTHTYTHMLLYTILIASPLTAGVLFTLWFFLLQRTSLYCQPLKNHASQFEKHNFKLDDNDSIPNQQHHTFFTTSQYSFNLNIPCSLKENINAWFKII